MSKHSIELINKYKDNYEHYIDGAAELTEQMDEFDCSLRDVVTDIIAQYLWRNMHLNEASESFCSVVKRILDKHVDFDVYMGDLDEAECEISEESKVLMKF